MHRNTFFLILFLLVLAGGFWFGKQALKKRLENAQQVVVAPTPSPSPEVAETSLPFTPQQKIALLLAYPLSVSNGSATSSALLTDEADAIRQDLPGFFTIFGSGISLQRAQQAVGEVRSLYASSAAEMQPLFAVDHEGGTVQRLSGKGFTRVSSLRELCTELGNDALAAHPDLAGEIASSAAELRAAGVQILFGPVVDVASSSSFLKTRSCGNSPELVQQHTQDWAKIFAAQGILPVIKHYPGIGSAHADPHISFSTVSATLAEKNIFFETISTFPNWGVMVSHDGERSPCSLDKHCIQELREMAPNALLFSDGLEMAALAAESEEEVNMASRSAAALLAGNDVLVFGGSVTPTQLQQIQEFLMARYVSDTAFQKNIDAHVLRVLEYKAKLLSL